MVLYIALVMLDGVPTGITLLLAIATTYAVAIYYDQTMGRVYKLFDSRRQQ